jgi:hypothetical protein
VQCLVNTIVLSSRGLVLPDLDACCPFFLQLNGFSFAIVEDVPVVVINLPLVGGCLAPLFLGDCGYHVKLPKRY